MKTNRRKFLNTGAVLALGTAVTLTSSPSVARVKSTKGNFKERFDPWIEIIPDAMRSNINVLYRLANKRPIMAVIKNNGYGLGQENIPKIIENMPEVAGFAAVKTDACLSLREGGVKKTILHMGMATDEDFYDLAANNIQLSIYSDNIRTILDPISKRLGQSVMVHQYIDTGMSRMGIPHRKALAWMEDIASSKSINVIGSFMGFTEDKEFDREQLKRLVELDSKAKAKGINIGKLHAASSHAIYHFAEANLDMVRPGIAIYGAYPDNYELEKSLGELTVAYKLKARVVRVEKLQAGDSVSYGRKFIADKPTWIATLPIGHSDGYTRNAVKGVKVLIGKNTYPVIGAVSASHTILKIGENQTVRVGDEAVLIGSDHHDIHPNQVARVAGVSVYDILMHMSAKLTKYIV